MKAHLGSGIYLQKVNYANIAQITANECFSLSGGLIYIENPLGDIRISQLNADYIYTMEDGGVIYY